VYKEVLIGSLDYTLGLAQTIFNLPLEKRKRQALMDFLGPVLQRMVEVSRKAGEAVKEVSLENVFPWLSSENGKLGDFLAHAARTVEEFGALPNQLFIEKFLLPQPALSPTSTSAAI
jgi:hypothetical protein